MTDLVILQLMDIVQKQLLFNIINGTHGDRLSNPRATAQFAHSVSIKWFQ